MALALSPGPKATWRKLVPLLFTLFEASLGGDSLSPAPSSAAAPMSTGLSMDENRGLPDQARSFWKQFLVLTLSIEKYSILIFKIWQLEIPSPALAVGFVFLCFWFEKGGWWNMFWGRGQNLYEHVCFMLFWHVFSFSTQNHAESLWNYGKTSFLDPTRAKFDE